MKDPNPAAASNNQHHMGGYRSQEEFWNDNLGKGPGEPSTHGHYPGQEPEQSQCTLCNPKVMVEQEATDVA